MLPCSSAYQEKERCSMTDKKIPHRLYLPEEQMPKQWFNRRSAMPEQPDPLLAPDTLRPLEEKDLYPICLLYTSRCV